MSWLHSIGCLFVMRLCMSFNFNAVRNVKFSEYVWNADAGTCTYQQRSEGDPLMYQAPIYLVEFFLPALGGLMVDKWFGELRVLRAAGVLLLLSGIYVTTAEMSQIICSPVLYLLGLLPSCLAFGVGVSPLLSTPMKLSHGHFGSPIPGLITYYTAAALGEIIGYLPRYARPTVDLTWIVCLSPMIYISASAVLSPDWTEYRHRVRHELEDGFLFPTRARLLRYFVLLAPLVLMVSVITTVRGVTYCQELNFYLNCSGNCTSVTCAEVFGGYNIFTVATLLILAGLFSAGCLGKEGGINPRFYAGTVVLLLSKVALIPWHLWAAGQPHQPDPDLTHSVYGAASSLDGVANGLALASGYELIFRIAPAHSKNLVMGFMFTMWAIGTGLTGFVIMQLSLYPHDNPVLRPRFGQSNQLYIVYIVTSVESAAILVYFCCFNTRLAPQLMTLDDCRTESQSDDETIESESSSQSLLRAYGTMD